VHRDLPLPANLPPRFDEYHLYFKSLPRKRCGLQRQWNRSLVGIALIVASGMAPVLAAMITVSGVCRLTSAISSANTNTAGGGCMAGRGADTTLPPDST
jgi:hypothetical protein